MRTGFAENLAVQAGQLVAADDQRVRVLCGQRLRLGGGETQRGFLRIFSGQSAFIDVRACSNKRNFQAFEQFAAKGRTRSQHN